MPMAAPYRTENLPNVCSHKLTVGEYNRDRAPAPTPPSRRRLP